MIIVDAMKFAYTHRYGATLCFITGDVDYAYLLAELQQPQWTTIVISKGTIQSMLHVNCDMKMRWETDVLQLRPSPSPHKPPPGFNILCSDSHQVLSNENSVTLASPTLANTAVVRQSFAAVLGSAEAGAGDLAKEVACDGSLSSFEALTVAEEWTDDAELLRSILTNGTLVGVEGPGTLKSYAGQRLRQTNPARFPNRLALQAFLAKAIETGIVVETGHGADKVLHLPDQYDGAAVPAICLSEKVPLPTEDMPAKAIELSSVRPYILFLQKFRIPPESNLPDKAFIQASGMWMILMFQKLTEAQRAVAAKPWLRSGILVDWRRAGKTSNKKIAERASVETNVPETIPCSSCEGLCLETDLFIEPGTEGFFCRTCFTKRDYWTESEQSDATDKVISIMKMMADNDDVYVPRNILRKALTQRWPVDCASRDQAALWIESAMEAGAAIEMKQQNIKAKVICLPENIRWVLTPFPPADTLTTAEEEYVKDLLWENEFSMTRKEVIGRLKGKFPRMNTPMMRTKVFLNAAANGSFFVAKGPNGQAVALSKEDAYSALEVNVADIVSTTEASLNAVVEEATGEASDESDDDDSSTVSRGW